MHYLDPDGPIDPLREALIELTKAICEKMPTTSPDRLLFMGEVIPRMRTDDDYVRFQARRLLKVAKQFGVPFNIQKH